MLAWVNDQIIGRKAEQDKQDDDGSSGTDYQTDENKDNKNAAEENEGTIILDSTCAPQNIRFPTDVSLLNEALEKTEDVNDNLHEMGLTEENQYGISNTGFDHYLYDLPAPAPTYRLELPVRPRFTEADGAEINMLGRLSILLYWLLLISVVLQFSSLSWLELV